jgi:hypothetical protein
MGTQKWSEIKKLSRATEAERAEARAELKAELGGFVAPPGTIQGCSITPTSWRGGSKSSILQRAMTSLSTSTSLVVGGPLKPRIRP